MNTHMDSSAEVVLPFFSQFMLESVPAASMSMGTGSSTSCTTASVESIDSDDWNEDE